MNARIPKIRAIIDPDINKIYSRRYDATYDTEPVYTANAHDRFNITKYVQEFMSSDKLKEYGCNNVEFFPQVNLVTIKGSDWLENTKLSTPTGNYKKLYELGDIYNDSEGIEHTTDDNWVLQLNDKNYGDNEIPNYVHESKWKTNKKTKLFYVDDNGYVYKGEVPSTGHWEESIPTSQDKKPIKLSQVKSNDWVATELQTIHKLNTNPNLHFEFERKVNNGSTLKSPLILNKVLGTADVVNTNNGVTVEEVKNLSVNVRRSILNIRLGCPLNASNMGSVESIINFTSGKKPVFIERYKDKNPTSKEIYYLKAYCDKVVDLNTVKKFGITVRTFGDKYLIIKSQELGIDWRVELYSKTGGEVPICIPKGYVAVSCYGLGVMNFGFTPIRFQASSNYLKAPPEQCKGNNGNGIWISQNGIDTLIKKSIKYNLLNHLPDKPCSVRWYDDIKAGLTKSIQIGCELVTLNDLYSPEVNLLKCTSYRVYKPVSPPTTYVDYTIKSVNISSSMDINSLRISRTGSISFTNMKTVIDGSIEINDNIDFKKLPVELCIKLEFAWDDPEKTDEALVWDTLFTGFLVNPSHSSGKYGESNVTYNMLDRWKQLSDTAMVNSAFYDGVKWQTTMEDLLDIAGVDSKDLIVSPDMVSLSPVLRQMPDVLANPLFRFQTNTGIDNCINITNDATTQKSFLYFNRDGKLVTHTLWQYIKDNIDPSNKIYDPLVFRNYKENNTDNHDLTYDEGLYNIDKINFYPPWNSIGNQNYSKLTDSVYNNFIINYNVIDPSGKMSIGYESSQADPSDYTGHEENRLPYDRLFVENNIGLITPKLVGERLKRTVKLLSQPVLNYTFATKGCLLEPGVPIRIIEKTDISDPNVITTGVNPDHIYMITSNSFDYDYSNLKATSEISSAYFPGLVLEYAGIST